MSSLFSSLWRGNSQVKLCATSLQNVISTITVRNKYKDVELPPNHGPKAGGFRRIVHYPEKYTVQPLNITRLGGRDPVSGRVVIKGIGGGIKRKYHWIEWKRGAPTDGPPVVEKVIKIMVDWCRTSHIALVAGGDKMKYYLATENMKAGDIITTTNEIPRIPVLAKEGNAHPLGALPNGTLVNNVEKYPGQGGCYIHAAGSAATVLRKVGNFVVIQLPSKHEVALPQECMATVGRLSNVEHANTPIGSAQRNRELGNRPRSGLWQRKDGRYGRKIKPLPPMKVIKTNEKPIYDKEIKLTMNNDMYYGHKLWSDRIN
ncbi:large ribosomal subunit protein uL2m [Halyomorpha halys]|uniref:large ribosomal subunit protein uL2m n=1 Tax=Halyomorpha halys TaxID=286706 RepID=UPI0006D51189|nr:39S ribosomal protein L2, mitochondrial [Halyomorpha halys]